MDIRTRNASVSFLSPFTLNPDVGELPPGAYDIDIDEEAIQANERTAYRRLRIYFFVRSTASTRTIIATPADLDKALERDREQSAACERDQPSCLRFMRLIRLTRVLSLNSPAFSD